METDEHLCKKYRDVFENMKLDGWTSICRRHRARLGNALSQVAAPKYFADLKYGFPNHNKTGKSKAANQTTKPMCHYMHWVSRLWNTYCSLFKEMFKIMSLSVVNLTFCFCLCCLQFLLVAFICFVCTTPKYLGIKQATLSIQKPLNPRLPVLQWTRLQCQSLGLSHTTIQFILKRLRLNPSWKKLGPCWEFLLKNWQ